MSQTTKDIPSNWLFVTLDKLGKLEWGNTSITKKSYVPKGVVAFSATGPDGFLPEAEWFGPGIVVSAIGANCGKCFYANGEWATIKNTIVFQSNEEFILSKFLYYQLDGQRNWYISGSGQPFITLKTAREKKIVLPPLKEQTRIVEKIEELFSELDKGIESLKAAREQLKIYRQSVLKHAFEGKLTEGWRLKNGAVLEDSITIQKVIRTARQSHFDKHFEMWKNGHSSKPKKLHSNNHFSNKELAELSALPEKWAWIRWEDILSFEDGSFKRGPFGSALKKEFFVKHSNYKVYEQYCPINDDCSYERYYVTDEKFKELQNFSVNAGDFLISCSGVTLGRITQVPENSKSGIINQALLRVRLNEKFYNPEFFKLMFRSRYFQKRIFENSTGSAIPNVKGVGELKAIPIPICDIREQNQIVLELKTQLSNIEGVESEIMINLQKSEALRQSILKAAFSGKLVPQDPSDEPASVLLERIKADAAKSPVKKGGRE